MKKILIDLDKLGKSEKSTLNCDYYYHDNNRGINHLREKAHFAIICRKCEEADCIKACPTDALQKDDKGVVTRSNTLCIGCNSCAIACPFGTIYTELIPFFAFRCDECLDRTDDKKKPVCVAKCPDGTIQYGDFKEDEEKHIYHLSGRVYVHLTPWKKE